uniref:Uncharacterized protein n=1 Tax=viral metagenome TaxID=1070528 RepID=A0A6C0EBV5_9ZZZZ
MDVEKIDKIMNSHNYDPLIDYTVTDIPSPDVSLSDIVFIFFNGVFWNIITLDTVTRYPIIYNKYASDNSQIDVSVIICPLTLRSTIVKGKFRFVKYENATMILTNDDNDLLRNDIGMIVNEKHQVMPNKRFEIKIKTLRSALIDFQDCKYLNPVEKKNPIINNKYYLNDLSIDGSRISSDIHPKTLVMVIQYLSSKGENKNTVIVGADAQKIKATGYDDKSTYFNKYLKKYYDKMIERKGYVINILWCYVKYIYKNAKIIYL